MTAPVTAAASVSKLKGIHDLGYCATRFGASIHSGFQQDWIGLGANVGAMLGKGMWYAKDKINYLVEKQKNLFKGPTPTYIVDIGIVAVAITDLINGFGEPTRAECLDTGKEQLDNVDLHLRLALPDEDKWSGAAAKKYGGQVRALQKVVQDMKEVDAKMQDLLQSQAHNVQIAHTTCAVTGLSLVAAQGIALALFAIPVKGPAISWAWQVAAVTAGIGAVVFAEEAAQYNSGIIAGRLEKVLKEYNSIAKRAEKAVQGTFAQIAVPGAQESTVGSFEAISTGMSGPSAMPTVPSLAGLAGGDTVGGESAPPSALADDGETPVETSDTPVWTPPTLAQVTATSGQFAKLSGHLSQHMNLVNQTMGQIQQLASMAKQSQGAVAPAGEAAVAGAAPEEAALAGDVEGAGAGVDTEGAERAPIEVAAAGAGEAQEPSPVERIA